MSAVVVAPVVPWGVPATEPDIAYVRVALLGTGAVGSAFLQRLQGLEDRGECPVVLVHVANSRRAVSADDGLVPAGAGLAVAASDRLSRPDDVETALGASGDGARVVVDATASADVALRHPYWLEGGIHVVTACKIARGGPQLQARRVAAAAQEGGTTYGDSATVGAGLPVLRTIRELRRGGDAILGLSGVLSGSLAWLLDRYDGRRAFGALVEEARALGYTEPDPRVDLSGEDVRRKLLILTRAAGESLEPEDITVEPLLAPPPGASEAGRAVDLTAGIAASEARLAARLAASRCDGTVLRYLARWDADGARVGIEALARDHPLAPASGCDNRVAIFSSRYRESPLVLQGPGAGPGVTAAALLDDVLQIARA